MNLSQIEYFIATAKYLNFTAAAKSMFISQPSLSKQIALLEDELGVELFQRDKRSVKLTLAGEVFFEEFMSIISQMDKAVDKVKGVGRGSTGSINIGCLESINLDGVFPDIVEKYMNIYSGCSISIEKCGFYDLKRKLSEGVFDIIFTLSFEIDSCSTISYKKICDRKGCFAMSPKHHLSNLTKLKVEELQDETFIVISEKQSAQASIKAYDTFENLGIKPKNIKVAANLETLINYLELGIGIAILDRSIGEYRKDKLKFYDLPHYEGDFAVVCAWRKDNINPSLTLFNNLLCLNQNKGL